MIFLDTPILVYAVGRDHPLRAPSARIVEAVRANRLSATTTIEVVQEFTHVFGRRRSRTESARLGRAWATLLAPLVSTEREDLELGLSLYEAHPRLDAFDCILAAAALRNGADGLVSADGGFRSIPGLRVVDLVGEEIERLLGPARS